uniref:Cytochrome P450 n=1 Tax=Peronospora matthiolae TaxID=2874970 RepID=A0AAV1V354_9STRA
MWSSARHDGTQQSVLLAVGALTAVYASWKLLSLPVPVPDPGMETLFRPSSTLPILGNTLDVLLFNRYRMSDWINDQTDASGGKPWLLQLLFQPPWVVLSLPNDLHDVFVDKFDVFEKGGALQDISFDVLGNGLLNVNGAKWKQQRRAASHLFSTKSIRQVMEPVIREKTRQLRDVLAQCAKRGQTVSMKSLLGKFTSDVFTRIGFGVELDQLAGDVLLDEMHPLDIALRAVQNRFQTPMWMWKLQRFFNVGAEKRLRANMNIVNDMVRDIMVRSMREAQSTGEDQLNVLALLMRDNANANPRELQDTAVNFFIAGKDTTSFSLSWLIVMMNRYPRVLQKIREELRAVVPGLLTGETDVPTLEETQQLVYLDAAVKESVRLQSVSTYRCTTRDATLSDGAFITKGTVVVVSKYAAARRKTVWGDDAAEYRPERWFDEATGAPKNITPPQFITFSTGPRKCIGMRLAMLEMKTVMAVLFSRFEIETVEDPFEITYDFSFVLPVKGPLAVRVRELAACCA